MINGKTKVTFYASLGFLGGEQSVTYTLEEIGWKGETGRDLERLLEWEHDNFLECELSSGWSLEEE